jgi:hypothetical protein
MFDLSKYSSQKPSNTIPDGKYICNVTDAGMKDTKSGGMMIVATFTVRDGEHKGRKVFHNFNVENSNAKAVEIGMGQIKSLLENAGKNADKLESAQALCGLTVGVKTKTNKSEQYGDKTEVSYFFKPETAALKNEEIQF